MNGEFKRIALLGRHTDVRVAEPMRALALHLIALSLFPFIVRGVAEPALGIDYSEQGLDELQSNALRILQRGLSP